MKKSITKTIKSFFMVLLGIVAISGSFPVIAADATDFKPLEGKTISILGDSISTYENISSGDAALTTNSTIKNNWVYYTNNKNGVKLEDTWWTQISEKLGGRILVNNSYSRSSVFDPVNNYLSQGYLNRTQNLHDNTGINNGEKPDVIFVYMGYNDLSADAKLVGYYSNINFDQLIKPSNNAVYYSKPKTTLEAYSIMIHKIRSTYPEAEVYCFNLSPRSFITEDNIQYYYNFNSGVKSIAQKFGCILVDCYNDTGLLPDEENIYYYLADGLHPNRNGMDALTNSFLKAFYENSRYMDNSKNLYNVNYESDNVIIDQGTLKTVPENDSFFCSFSSKTNGPINIEVFIDGVDCTNLYATNDYVYIPQVTGHIDIKAKTDSVPNTEDSYRFTIEDNNIKNVIDEENLENTITLNNGYINDNTIIDGSFRLGKTFELLHNKPWSVVWKAEYNTEFSPITLSQYYLAEKEMNTILHFIKGTSTLCISQIKNGEYTSYGIDLSKHNIDITQNNEYRISNIIADDGSNMIYLFVNSTKISAFNRKILFGVEDTLDKKWCNGKDFYFNHIGTPDSPINGCKLEYIQVWENTLSEKHKHNYIYSNAYMPTCDEPGYNDLTCQCGYGTTEITSAPLGHTPSTLIIDVPASPYFDGKGHIECTVCDDIIEEKVLPQTTPDAPRMISLTNETNGVTIRWSPVAGADTYRIYRRGAGSTYWTYLGTTTERSFLDKTATNNNYWRYTVRSCNEAGFGAFDTNGLYTKYLSTPKITGAANTINGINIKWSSVAGATRYYVYRNRVGLSNWTYIGSSTTTEFNDTSIKNANGVDYRYTVKAYSGYTSSYYPDGYVIKRLSAPTLQTIQSYPTGIYLNWSPVAGSTGYYVYRKTLISGWQLIGTAGTSNPAYFDKTAQKGIRYTYTVKAVHGKTMSDYYPKGITCIDKY